MKITHDPFEQLDLNALEVIVGGRSLTSLPNSPGSFLSNVQAASHPAAAETDMHGVTFLGGIATVSAGIALGPFNVGGSLAMGGPDHDLYGSFHWGIQDRDEDSSNFSFTAGVQVGGVFGYPGASYDDVVTGHSTGLALGIASIAANDHGFVAQAGSAGFGVSLSDTVNLTTDHSVDAAGDHSPAPNLSGDHGPQDTSPDHGGEESGDQGSDGLAHDDQGYDVDNDISGNDAGHDFGGDDFGGNDAGHDFGGDDFGGNDIGHDFDGSDFDGGYFGNDFGDSNFGGGDFGGSDFGGSDFA